MSEPRSRSPHPRPDSPGEVKSDRKELKGRDRSRSRSRSREAAHRNSGRRRSPSPRKDHRSKRKDGGFKWKERRRNDDDPPRDREEGLRRGYRDQYKPRSRSRSPRRRDYDRYDERDRNRDKDRDRFQNRDRHQERQERDREPTRTDDRGERPAKKEKRAQPEEKAAAPAVPMSQQQPMIIVTVNDRLGTKKQIPCFPTDSVRDFKIIVASMIGRKPHEILLKRQGERPFKDVLTLQDYGVSNNVQLDLEVDTGD